eukprot:8334235-Pyramimonas_sp.AAC.1
MLWDDAATLVRAKMNQRIGRYKVMVAYPGIRILDGVSLYGKLPRPADDAYLFFAHHDSYMVEQEIELQKATVAKIFEDRRLETAKLAALFFSASPLAAQPFMGLDLHGKFEKADAR